MTKCTYEGCDSPAAFLCPQIATHVEGGFIYLPVCADDRAHWWEGGDYTEDSCPLPTIPFVGGTECGPNAHTERRGDNWMVVWNSDHPDRGQVVANLACFASEKELLKAYDRFAPPVFERRPPVRHA